MAKKTDLFSDDLFDDETEMPAADANAKSDKDSPKRKYLEQDWKLNADDAKDFKGFPKPSGEVDLSTPAEAVPCYALMYKFRREYFEASVDSMIADHKGHCTKFKRLLNSEVVNLGKAKGVVLLWAGFTEEDKAETKAEIMSFMEEDPLIAKDVVENWDLIDLSKSD